MSHWDKRIVEQVLVEGDHFTVNTRGVTNIECPADSGEGGRWYFDVYYENGAVVRIFNPTQAVYSKPMERSKNDDIPF